VMSQHGGDLDSLMGILNSKIPLIRLPVGGGGLVGVVLSRIKRRDESRGRFAFRISRAGSKRSCCRRA